MMFDAECPDCHAITPTPIHYEGISIKCSGCAGKFLAVDPREKLFKFHCSACGGRIQAKEKLRGTMAPCPHCDKVVPVGDYNMDTRPLPDAIPKAKKVESATQEGGTKAETSKASTTKLGETIGKIFGGKGKR